MILVTGATGSIGHHLVRHLSEAGAPFKALVRDAAKGERLGCEVVLGDFDDPGSLAAALRGVDRLLLNGTGAVPVTGEQPMIRQQKAVIDAARVAGVAEVVKISVLDAHEGGRLSEGAHWEIEQYLKASGPAWTILQPGAFMQNFVTGSGAFSEDGHLLGLAGGARMSYIDCLDIAACAATILTGSRVSGATHVLTGPEALSQAEIAELMSRALGRTVRSIEVTPEEMTVRLTARGLPSRFAEDVVALWLKAATGPASRTTSTVEALLGRPPRTFAEFLADNRSAFG
ncbi:SDR family oxidoreductase [Spirillospora sp. CA-294931]|uniref:SDR family oxidoreductase n=1 Tax=Spirillospora sp. CA-294931 TaxID=3240042 RepID=UPI003D941FE8